MNMMSTAPASDDDDDDEKGDTTLNPAQSPITSVQWRFYDGLKVPPVAAAGLT